MGSISDITILYIEQGCKAHLALWTRWMSWDQSTGQINSTGLTWWAILGPWIPTCSAAWSSMWGWSRSGITCSIGSGPAGRSLALWALGYYYGNKPQCQVSSCCTAGAQAPLLLLQCVAATLARTTALEPQQHCGLFLCSSQTPGWELRCWSAISTMRRSHGARLVLPMLPGLYS